MINKSVPYEFMHMRGAIPIAQVRPRLTEILDSIQREPVTVTKDGKPVAVIVDPLHYESLLATLEVLANPEHRRHLEAYEAELAAGRAEWVSHEEVERLIGG